MPDPDRKTISATEASALFNCNPYVTRWMLYQRFAKGLDISSPPNNRTEWGKRMQPLICKQVAAETGKVVIPNHHDEYFRRGLLGCTPDATILCPERGPGSLEIKCVFDYDAWGRHWHGGETVPRHIEIQLQTQMYVGINTSEASSLFGTNSHEWGMISVWVCADLFFFERTANHDLWHELKQESFDFFERVKDGREPDPFGVAVESPYIASLYPTREGKELDLSEHDAHVGTATSVSSFKMYKELENSSGDTANAIRLRLLALAKDAEYVKLPCGVSYRVKKSGKGRTIVPYVPDTMPSPPPSTNGSAAHDAA